MRQWQTRVRYISGLVQLHSTSPLPSAPMVWATGHCHCPWVQLEHYTALYFYCPPPNWMRRRPNFCAPLFIAQNNRMQQTYEGLNWTFRSWNLCIFLTNVGQIFILVLFLTFTFILTHICQSTIGSRMSWSNIFDFQQMCKEVARDGPCFYPGGLKSLVRAISLFLSLFHFSQAGRKRGVQAGWKSGHMSWPKTWPKTTCSLLQLHWQLCIRLLQTPARESLVCQLFDWSCDPVICIWTGAWRIIS